MTLARSTDTLDGLLQRVVSPGIGCGAVLLTAVDGTVVSDHALGTTRQYDSVDVPTTVPGKPVTRDTAFDLASLTKPLVAATLLTELAERGYGPELPVAEVLSEFRTPEAQSLTVGHLLTHTFGFTPTWPDRSPDPGGRRFRAAAQPSRVPMPQHEYSCLNFIWAGYLAEALAEAPLPELVRRRVLDPLGMRGTGYLPAREHWSSIAATEFQPARGMVQGQVHDETAFALGGAVGNAGIFGTAPDIMRFAETVRTGTGLTPQVHTWLTEPVQLPAGAPYEHTYGLRRAEPWCAATPRTAVSHTGFTGTAFLTEPGGSFSLVLFTNRVHPTRTQTALPTMRASIVAAAVSSAGL
ncbi:beta-lactamase family protein [Leucobacter sp. cx-328]|uniref:serine hydrolase domain-containing protein n=1 Tax=unclassified Leucobacter TaxID=2621730 RepID=UPI00165EA4E2|nr:MULTISPECIES: serine hydrolase domain-containing protein [unclassified Leucobacter]MBC9944094.1 beta-lactamase family protein [Leucobacter sp. cx-328]